MRDRRNRLVEARGVFIASKCALTTLKNPLRARFDSTEPPLLCSMSCAKRRCSAHVPLADWRPAGTGRRRAERCVSRLVFELLAWSVSDGSEPRLISGDAMARAGCYLDYLASMFDRVTAGLAYGGDEADAATIARHILSARATVLNERALYGSEAGRGYAIVSGGRTRCACSRTADGCGGRSALEAEGRVEIGRYRRAYGRLHGEPLATETAEINRDAALTHTVQNIQNVQNGRSSLSFVQIEHIEQRKVLPAPVLGDTRVFRQRYSKSVVRSDCWATVPAAPGG